METGSRNCSRVRAVGLQFGHGCDAVETVSSASRIPQHTSRFNSATVVMPWKPKVAGLLRTEDFKLQFGHGCDAVETSESYSDTLMKLAASIRPRL